MGTTLLFAILTIIINITKTCRSEVTAHSSTSSCAYPHINMRTYVVGVFVQARIIMLPGHGPGPGPVLRIDDS